MAQQTAGLRQRGKGVQDASAATPADKQQAADTQEALTLADKFSWYFAQHGGLVFCGVGIGLLGFGYDKGWMNNTHLCLLCLVLCLIGLFFHEFRPFNAQQLMEEQQKAASAAGS